MNSIFSLIFLLLTICAFPAIGWALPSIDGKLQQQILSQPLLPKPVVITFDHQPAAADFLMLRSLGIRGGWKLDHLPMVLTRINKAQFDALRQRGDVRSLYGNHIFPTVNNESKKFIGVEKLMRDSEVTNRLGTGQPVSGKNVGVAYIDTGIDATHPDLQLGGNVIQNVLFPTAEIPLNLPPEFVPVLPIENQPMTDVEGGHGTFGAGILAGTGAASGGFYAGVAPGAKLIGITTGNDVGLSTFAILQSLNYTLVTQFLYNIRVCNNSYGTTLAAHPYDPLDPVNVATRALHDRNIAVVFAAGNDGDAPDAINPFSVAPWVISVAAGEKRGLGTPAGFSSRGNDNGTGTDTPGQPADETAAPNFRPDITGSGVDIKSTRSKAPGVTNVAGTIPAFVGSNDLSTIPPAFLPYYTTSQGTSFSTPQVSGVIALMLEANPLLTPDEIVTILRQTANPMPYEERVVGAGYVDAHNAVRAALQLTAGPHPANLFPSNDPNAPQISDPVDDQLGTTAQDIRSAKFVCNPANNEIVYTITLADLSARTPNMRWTMTSTFGATDIFVTASVDELATTYEYGKITTLATGTRNQETVGAVDSGEIVGDQIIIRLSIDKISQAVGSSVLYTTSTNTQAQSQILVGSSLSGGLLLNSDQASGSDFAVCDQPPPPTPTPTPTPTITPTPTPEPTPSPTPTPTPSATPTPSPTPTPSATPTPNPTPTTPTSTSTGCNGRFEERYSDTLSVGEGSTMITFAVRRQMLTAVFTQNYGSQPLRFELFNSRGAVVRVASNNKINLSNLPNGTYYYRISGNNSRAVDFTVKSTQRNGNSECDDDDDDDDEDDDD